MSGKKSVSSELPLAEFAGGDSVVYIREYPAGYCPIEAGKKRCAEEARLAALGRLPPPRKRRGGRHSKGFPWVVDAAKARLQSARVYFAHGLVISFVERDGAGGWTGWYGRDGKQEQYFVRVGDDFSPVAVMDSEAAIKSAVVRQVHWHINVWCENEKQKKKEE